MKNLITEVQLFSKLCFRFGRNEKILKNLSQVSTQLKMKQTIQDKKNLQSFLSSQTSKGELLQNIERTAKYDKEFREFLKDYQRKNKEYPNIMDLSHYTRETEALNKTQSLRQEEINMIEEFRKRRQNQQQNEDQPDYMKNEDNDDINESSGDKQQKKIRLSLNDDFMIVLVERDITTLVTKLNRVNHYRYLVFMGNCNGVIGYGKGKGNDFEEALDNAVMHCKKNLIAVNLDHQMTLPRELKSKYNDVNLTVTPRDSFNSWGHPILAAMLMLTGVNHCRFKLIFRNMNPYALVYSYFKLITQNTTPKELCEQTGQKVYRMSWGKPYFMENMPYLRL